MRKLKLQMQISLDGFNSTGPNDEQKWVTWAWDEIKQDVLNLASGCDTELIGRKLAVDYIPYWTDTLTPFGNILGIMTNIHYLDILKQKNS